MRYDSRLWGYESMMERHYCTMILSRCEILPLLCYESRSMIFWCVWQGPPFKAPKDHSTKGWGDHRTRGPQDQKTTGPEDHRTRGPQDQRTAGPEDQGPKFVFRDCKFCFQGCIFFPGNVNFFPVSSPAGPRQRMHTIQRTILNHYLVSCKVYANWLRRPACSALPCVPQRTCCDLRTTTYYSAVGTPPLYTCDNVWQRTMSSCHVLYIIMYTICSTTCAVVHAQTRHDAL